MPLRSLPWVTQRLPKHLQRPSHRQPQQRPTNHHELLAWRSVQGLAGLFRDTGHDVVASLGDCGDLEDAVREHAPDVVVLDVRLPRSFTDEGTRAAAALKSTRPDLGVVLLSHHIETAHSVELAGLGGFGYLLKDRVLDVSDFLSAVSRVADGGSALDPQVVAALLNRNARLDSLAQLADREHEVLRLMAQG